MSHQIVIAHNVLSGAVVYLTNDSQWSPDVQTAAVAEAGESADRLLSIAQKFEQSNTVMGAELIPVAFKKDTITPLRLRERIRAFGPTVAYQSSHAEKRV